MTTPITPERARDLAIDLSFSDAAVALRSLADQVEALTAELARPDTTAVSLLRAERDAALTLAADRLADSERYQWLRDDGGNEIMRRLENILVSELWDAAIDAARAES